MTEPLGSDQSDSEPPAVKSVPASPTFRFRSLLSIYVLAPVLLVLVLAVFGNALSGEFVYDDIPAIAANPLLGHWDQPTLTLVLTRDLWAPIKSELTGSAESAYYRPAFSLFLMLVYEFAGRNPTLWHLASVLLHWLVALMVLMVLERSLAHSTDLGEERCRLIAVAAACIFAVHPVQSEAVVWISASTNPLLALFLLAAFYTYLRARELGSARTRLILTSVSLLFYGLAVLTKESAVATALIVPAYELVVLNRGAGLEQKLRRATLQGGPFVAAALGYFVLRYLVLGTWLGRNINANYPDEYSLTLLDTVRTLPSLLLFYVRLALYPFGQSMIYDQGHVRSMGFQAFWAPLVAVCAIGVLLFRCFKRIPETRAAIIWIAIPVAFHLNTRMFVSDDLIHDRYLYIPMAGISLFISIWLLKAAETLKGRFEFRWAMPAVIALFLTLLAISTITQNGRWQDEDSLWLRTAEHAPHSRMVNIALGLLAEKRQDLDQALGYYEKALELDPNIVDALNNSAFVYAHQGRWPEATGNFESIVSLTPSNPMSHFNLAVAYAAQKRYSEEEQELQRAIELDPSGPRSEEWRSRLIHLARISSGS